MVISREYRIRIRLLAEVRGDRTATPIDAISPDTAYEKMGRHLR